MTDLPPIANALSNILFILLVITFVHALCLRFITDATIYDRTNLPSGDPDRLTYYVEPSPSPDEMIQYPSIFDLPEIDLSVIIPAFNNDKTLSNVIEDTMRVLDQCHAQDKSFLWEIIVVDDNSSDLTAETVIGLSRNHEGIRLLRQHSKMGIGAATQTGCLHARGRLIVTMFADHALTSDQLEPLQEKMKELQTYNKSVVLSCRGHVDSSFSAKLSGIIMRLSGVKNVINAAKSVKMYSREAARWIFPNIHIAGLGVDAEIVALASKKKMIIESVNVESNVDSPKSLLEQIKTLGDLLKISLFYRMGLWTVKMRGSVMQTEEDI